MRDADENARAAFQSICSALKFVGLPVPPAPMVSSGSNPSVAAFVLPGEDKPGALEDLCLEAFQGEPVMSCVKEYFGCAKCRYMLAASVFQSDAPGFIGFLP